MQQQRRLSAIALLAAAVIFTTSCSAGPQPQANETGPVTIEYWDFVDPAGSGPRSVALKANIEAFEKANSNITVNVQVVPFADSISRLPQAAASRQEPDVARVFTTSLSQMNKAGVFQALDDYAKDVPKDDWIQPWESTVIDGKKMTMPYEHRASALLYNKRVLQEQGIAVPATWDQLVDASGKLTKAGFTGFGTGFSKTADASVVMELFSSIATQSGGSLFNGDALNINNAAGERFFGLFGDLKTAGALKDEVVQGSYETVNEGLSNGTVPLAVLGTHRVKSTQAANPDIGWAPLPVFPGAKKTASITGWSLGMGANTEHPAAAWKFIEFMTSPQAQAQVATGGEVPARVSAMDEKFLATSDGKQLADVADYIRTSGDSQQYPSGYADVSRLTAEALQSMYLEGTPAEDAQKRVEAGYKP
jgi:ABC-type glycerol-3-phosphate transport system substrate-binding protein